MSDSVVADEKYRGMTEFFGSHAPLSQGVGFAVVLGFGIFFSIFTTLLVILDQRFNSHQKETSEHFNTAGRSNKTGLTAAVIVSKWTWAATLLQSSNVAFNYGVSGPFWYASGATIQVLLFGILAIEIKDKAPTAHTFCEIVRARWGNTAHKVFIYFAFLTNIIVTSMLILGGAATTSALTGMNVYAASFLIPLGIIAYTAHGGLKATFLADYVHTSYIFIVLCLFVFTVYSTSPKLGSVSLVYDNLRAVVSLSDQACKDFGYDPKKQLCGPVSGNKDGEYLTMLSTGGLMFGIINVVGNFGTVFVDQAYWQSAIAAEPSSAHRGYLLGGMCWFTIPFALATSLGLGAIALQLPLTYTEAGRGLVPPATALTLLGKSGAATLFIMLFMAVTAAGSAELLAVSSLIAYDIYRPYINPAATGEDILRVSRYGVLGFGIFMGVFAAILNAIGLSLGWVYEFMGCVIGSAVVPVWLCMTWRKATAKAAITGALVGQAASIVAWLAYTSGKYGTVSIATTGMTDSMLTGNCIAIGVSGIITWVMSLMDPDDYNWDTTRQITLVDDDRTGLEPEKYTRESLDHARLWINKYGWGFTILVVILWPVLSIPAGVFSLGYFKFWVAISMIWGVVATVIIVGLPLFETREQIISVICGLAGVTPPLSTHDLQAQLDKLGSRVARLEGDAGYIEKAIAVGAESA